MADPAPTPAATGPFRGERQRLEPISNSNEGEKCPIKSTQRAAGQKWELFRLPESKQSPSTGAGVGLSTWFNVQVIKNYIYSFQKVLACDHTWQVSELLLRQNIFPLFPCSYLCNKTLLSPHWNQLRGYTQQFTSSLAKIKLPLSLPENPGLFTKEPCRVSLPALTLNIFFPYSTSASPPWVLMGLSMQFSSSINPLSTFQEFQFLVSKGLNLA